MTREAADPVVKLGGAAGGTHLQSSAASHSMAMSMAGGDYPVAALASEPSSAALLFGTNEDVCPPMMMEPRETARLVTDLTVDPYGRVC